MKLDAQVTKLDRLQGNPESEQKLLDKEKQTKNRRREREKLESNKQDEEERLKKKQQIKDANKRIFVKEGRPYMGRSKKPTLKKKKSDKKEPTQAEKDFKRYVGSMFS